MRNGKEGDGNEMELRRRGKGNAESTGRDGRMISPPPTFSLSIHTEESRGPITTFKWLSSHFSPSLNPSHLPFHALPSPRFVSPSVWLVVGHSFPALSHALERLDGVLYALSVCELSLFVVLSSLSLCLILSVSVW
mmetsp:Transcript_18191/g.36888  ORF Transcript_18191/g.36888 Transcript_18191/m.36888 type:complete len:136 (-) Transcript_18191:716-1123(-)